MENKKINIENLLRKSASISIKEPSLIDLDKVLLKLFRDARKEYGDVWIFRSQIKKLLKEYTTVENRLDKLVIKGQIESKLYGTRVVYRLKVKE